MTGEEKQRVVPGPLKKLLQADIAITKQFCRVADQIIPEAKGKKFFLLLEYSCHGVAWVFASCAALWLLWSASLFQSQVNFIVGLFVDIFAVMVMKAFFRRRRPGEYDDKFTIRGIDTYSFPSGHVSRAFFIWYFFAHLYPSHFLLKTVILAWAVAVAYSRVALRRHNLLDVVAGVVLGLAEGQLVSFIWLSGPTAAWIVSFLTEEALNLEGLHDGGEVVVD